MKKWFFVFVFLFLQSSWSFADVTLVSDAERRGNVVASALAGSWEMDASLGERFLPSIDASIVWKFKEDLSVLQSINAKEYGKSSDHRAYSAGQVTVRVGSDDVPFKALYVVIEGSGNPMVALFDPEQKEGKGDWEYMTVMLAKARKAKDDLLFIGGDRNENVVPCRRK